VAVGSPFENGGGHFEAGAVHIFNASTGKQVERLISPNAQSFAFGSSVDIFGKNLAVGASDNVNGHYAAGRVYIFHEENVAGRLLSKLVYSLKSPNPQYTGDFDLVVINAKFIVVGAAAESAHGIGRAGHTYIFYEPSS
jgi:hypothetical protein